MPSIWETAVPDRPDWRRYQERLEAVRTARYNFDLDTDRELTESDGWHLDHYDADLPPEPPGPPLPDTDARASFAIARDLIRNYAFPDPKLVTGIFSPDEPVEGRPMLLRARFLAFTFWFGVRVGRVLEGAVEVEGDRVWRYGYDYATLEGHFERGQITFQVQKNERTGAVSFVIDAFSKPDRIRNPFYRIGFKLFGRKLQIQFSESACERMQRFVRQELEARAKGDHAPRHETVTPEPVSKDADARDQIDEVVLEGREGNGSPRASQ
ncbi:DUF1990 family protein [Rubrivirga sp.]|uniref:DUF1990 family protein n=1 Tax=Rubrivirga sp. TaxID=1885344 RepID=UPI003C776537